MLLQKLGPAKWLSFQIVVWSLCATLQSCISNHGGFLATRFMLGALEAGYIPGGLYYISTWYKKKDLPIRYGIFFIGNTVASGCSGLIASGILKYLPGDYGLAGWKWIFIVEGAMGIGYGLIFAFFIPDSPQNPRPFHNLFSLFNKRESKVIRGAVLLDDPEKINSAKEISVKELKEVSSDWRTWMHFFFTFR
ncbi:unnamed protein product [Ambrosiozyma monospora]|uniref:Unnamed protein product n=1 Tax=Ambrosiozyma monospora TaxID=43982 RepID=A0ACB5U8F7_AMBMO|nr:unnamed protein product [Ambrosiozyma monospora]